MGLALSAMNVTSSAFAAYGAIPARHTGEGEDVSPQLAWSGAQAASALGGWFFLLRKVPHRERTGETHVDLGSLVPIGLIIAIGIAVAMIYPQIRSPISPKRWAKILLSRKTAGLVVLVAIIRVYGAFLEAPLPDGTYVVEQMRDELERSGVPILPLIMIIPFIAGLTTGIALGMVGASFPIIVGLAGPDPTIPATTAGDTRPVA